MNTDMLLLVAAIVCFVVATVNRTSPNPFRWEWLGVALVVATQVV